ncbi:leucyl aminopeptidase [Tessaracoccus bendigoensis DSM 12906]|uniref:Probable cytosol aminopeptidase n=1 Tax=Tessaracoccus bendigoensis DSM 12906 TaxID=1123357 RepID=A0A1M6KE39_9ACTN|nr:leucyl aminopeptidase [Tessaracoccus bendigoensis]SHJ57213.1 leucyl aminopeptidase [Tessaracoccus bendigoensis DSM 12906]
MKTLGLDPIPSRSAAPKLIITGPGETVDADALAIPVISDQPVPEALGVDLTGLANSGFVPLVGRALAFPSNDEPVLVAVGVGELADLTAAKVRDAAAAFARAVPQDARLASRVPDTDALPADVAAAAIVEGIVLARYAYSLRSTPPTDAAVTTIVLQAPEGQVDAVRAGAERGLATAQAASLGRDLATSPAGLLTASRFADIALKIAPEKGLTVEIFDRRALIELGCGGLLGVNKGSVEEPRMIVVKYVPQGESTGHLALVGKGIMYDAGGINLKPSDLSHSQMKNDMTGAADVFASMTALAELGCTNTVTGYLMCTDNMPSGSAMQLGDVLTMRGGKTVEVLNTDAEGRLVMADALVLAVEEGVDAVIDIATLTGACLRTFGEEVAGLMANDDELAAQVSAAGDKVDEPVWRLPLIPSYRAELNSDVADIKNIGGVNAGSITAGLFLKEFVGDVPWAHVDIAGTAQSSKAYRWINRGPTAFGTRLLVETALSFVPRARD